MPNTPIFFDLTGRRRKIFNFVMPLILISSVFLLLFAIVYMYRMAIIHKMAHASVAPSVSSSDTAMLYTEAHPNAYILAKDRIDKISKLFLPRYQMHSSGAGIPNNYQVLSNNIETISANRTVAYQTYYILSSKDYNIPPTERTIITANQRNIDTKLPLLIQESHMFSIRDDLLKHKASGLVIDFDISVIKSTQQMRHYTNWFERFKNILAEKQLVLGIIVNPKTVTDANESLLHHSQLLYITADYDLTSQPQLIDALTAKQQKQNIVYELATVSKDINLADNDGYVRSVDYASMQPYILGKKFERHGAQPIIINGTNSIKHIYDAVSISNQLDELRAQYNASLTEFAIADPGYEEYTAWNLLDNVYQTDTARNLITEGMRATVETETIGSGEIYSLQTAEQQGLRVIEYDQNNTIVSSQLQKENTDAVVIRVGNLPKKIALTFDDGPHPTRTKQVLDILDAYNVKGTFFLIGENVANYPSVAKEIVDRGHEVENHSYDHPVFSMLPKESQINQIKATSEIISEITGYSPKYFRMPYSLSSDVETQVDLSYIKELGNLGLRASEYDIDSKDWMLDSPEAVIQKVTADMNEKQDAYSQMLFHDTHENIDNTLQSLPIIIKNLQSQGIEFVRVDELAGSKNPLVGTTQAYRSIEVKNVYLFIFIWLYLMLVVIALAKYSWMIIGASVYYALHAHQKHKRAQNMQKPGRLPYIAVIIACYNEELVIERTLLSLLDCKYPRLKIIVIDDGSTDATADKVRVVAARHRCIQLISVPNGGKANALKHGIRQTRTKWLVFCDADTQFNSTALHSFAYQIKQKGKTAAIAGRILVGNNIKAITGAQAIEYGIAHLFAKPSQSIINSITVVPGAIGLWNRNALAKAGYFSTDTLAEDTDTTLTIIGQGKKVSYNSDILARTEAPDSLLMLYKQRTRWQLGNMQAIFKHKRGLFNPRYGALGFYGLPLLYIDILASIFYPLMLVLTSCMLLGRVYDLQIIIPTNVRFATTEPFFILGIAFIVFEIVLSLIVIASCKNSVLSKLKMVVILPYYMTVYKTLLSFATIVSLMRALRGTLHGWGHIKRTAAVAYQHAPGLVK